MFCTSRRCRHQRPAEGVAHYGELAVWIKAFADSFFDGIPTAFVITCARLTIALFSWDTSRFIRLSKHSFFNVNPILLMA